MKNKTNKPKKNDREQRLAPLGLCIRPSAHTLPKVIGHHLMVIPGNCIFFRGSGFSHLTRQLMLDPNKLGTISNRPYLLKRDYTESFTVAATGYLCYSCEGNSTFGCSYEETSLIDCRGPMNQCLEATGLDGETLWELEGDPLRHRALIRLIDRWARPRPGGSSYGKGYTLAGGGGA